MYEAEDCNGDRKMWDSIHLFFSTLSDWALKALSEDSGKKIEYPPKNYAEMGKLVHSCANWTEIDYCGSTS